MSDDKYTAGRSKGPQPRTVTGIDAIASGPVATDKAWVSFIKALNPLGPAAQALGETLRYRIECKRIEAEVERVQQQANAVSDAMRYEFELNMEHLKQRRLMLDRMFDTVQGELTQFHLERKDLMEILKTTNQRLCSGHCDAEERPILSSAIKELAALLPLMGGLANENLKTLVQALPVVPVPRGLLPNSSTEA